MGDKQGDEELEAAVRRLLSATRDFTRAYQAWSAAPAERERELAAAEMRLEAARHEVVAAQLRTTH